MHLPTERTLSSVAAVIAAISCILLFFESSLPKQRIVRRAIAIALAAAGVFAYFEFFSIPAPAFFHRWEMFHYVLGAKYADELGYERLYACVAVADAANGHREEVLSRPMRNLHDDELIPAATALLAPQMCTQHFTRQRWMDFQSDVAAMRRLVDDRATWRAMQVDHGFNPSPVWTLLGRPLASVAPVSGRLLRRLAWIDPLLMAASVGLFLWGFGWRIAWLALLFWSTQAPSNFSWTGGAFLRQDWLFLAIAALVLARRHHFYAAGACLAWAALLRVFPIVFFAGPFVLLASAVVRTRTIPRELRQFFVGAVLATAVLFAATDASGGGLASHRSFASHVYMHSTTPITNHMSLRALVSFAPDERLVKLHATDASTERDWTAARRARLKARVILHVLSVTLIAIAVVRCIWRLRTIWVAICLSFPLVMTFTDPSSYYYSMVVLLVPLARARRSMEVTLLGLAAASELLMLHTTYFDERYVALSALYLLFACVVVVVFSRPPQLSGKARASSRA